MTKKILGLLGFIGLLILGVAYANVESGTDSNVGGENPQPTTLSCVIESIEWNQEEVNRKDAVLFEITTNGNCEGSFFYEIYEKDFLFGDDFVLSDTLSVSNDGGTIQGSWTAEWQKDGFLGTPEFVIQAKGKQSSNDVNVRSTSGLSNTQKQTVIVKNINEFYRESSRINHFYIFNGELYFSADDGMTGSELWKTDGTPQGTVLIEDIHPNGIVGQGGVCAGPTPSSQCTTTYSGSGPSNFQTLNNQLFFTATTNIPDGIIKIMKLQGNNVQQLDTIFSRDIVATQDYTYYNKPKGIMDQYGFPRTYGELWRTNGFSSERVKQLSNSNPTSYYPLFSYENNAYIKQGNSLYVIQDDDPNKNLNYVGPMPASSTEDIVFNNYLYVSGDSNRFYKIQGNNFEQLFLSFNGQNIEDVKNFFIYGNELYFSANHPSYGQELWKLDASDNPLLVNDFNPGIRNSRPEYLGELEGVLYVTATAPEGESTPRRIFKTDGVSSFTKVTQSTDQWYRGLTWGPAHGGSQILSVGESINFNGDIFMTGILEFNNNQFIHEELLRTIDSVGQSSWKTGDWSDCGYFCGTQVRASSCESSQGFILLEGSCSGQKPPGARPCSESVTQPECPQGEACWHTYCPGPSSLAPFYVPSLGPRSYFIDNPDERYGVGRSCISTANSVRDDSLTMWQCRASLDSTAPYALVSANIYNEWEMRLYNLNEDAVICVDKNLGDEDNPCLNDANFESLENLDEWYQMNTNPSSTVIWKADSLQPSESIWEYTFKNPEQNSPIGIRHIGIVRNPVYSPIGTEVPDSPPNTFYLNSNFGGLIEFGGENLLGCTDFSEDGIPTACDDDSSLRNMTLATHWTYDSDTNTWTANSFENIIRVGNYRGSLLNPDNGGRDTFSFTLVPERTCTWTGPFDSSTSACGNNPEPSNFGQSIPCNTGLPNHPQCEEVLESFANAEGTCQNYVCEED